MPTEAEIAEIIAKAEAEHQYALILRLGAETWNRWRKQHTDVVADLRGVDFSKTNLEKVDLSRVDLSEADLRGARLSGADYSGAKLHGAKLSRADLSRANLSLTDLYGTQLVSTDFSEARLNGANLSKADLSGAYLFNADLSGTRLMGANLSKAELNGANFGGANFGSTHFADVDLSVAKGLDTAIHFGPSTIGVDTIYRSQGKIPEPFLRGAGIPGNFISYMRGLVTNPVIQFYSCFISYSTVDQDFADRLYADLQANNVRCWFAPQDMKIGDKIWDRLDQSIRLHDKLLLILSANSINSEWVEDEVTTAFEEERKRCKPVLFPVRLDDCIMDTAEPWAAKVRQRHIGDFRQWKDHDAYQKTFTRLLRDLKADDKAGAAA
jgi:hypothetical protein